MLSSTVRGSATRLISNHPSLAGRYKPVQSAGMRGQDQPLRRRRGAAAATTAYIENMSCLKKLKISVGLISDRYKNCNGHERQLD